MASVKFYLEKRKSSRYLEKKEVPIVVSFTYDGKRIITTTGEKVKSHNWDPDQQRVKKSAKYSLEINDYLETMSENLMRYYRQTKILGHFISHHKLKNIIRNLNDEEEETKSILLVLDQFMDVQFMINREN